MRLACFAATLESSARHQSEPEKTPARPNTCGRRQAESKAHKPPSDAPKIPVCAGSVAT
jgi:hypothetical protein